MEEHKHRALQHFLRRVSDGERGLDYVISWFEVEEGLVKRIYAAYASCLDFNCLDQRHFLYLMVLDRCFLLELLLTVAGDSCQNSPTPGCYAVDDPIFRKGHDGHVILSYIQLDLLMVENQLPLVVLQKLTDRAERKVINCIWKHPSAPTVYLACDLLGQEEILVQVSRMFGSKIYVDRTSNLDFFQSLLFTALEIISEDASSRFQVIQGFPRLYERATRLLTQARAHAQPLPLFIRPSAQWYACDKSLGRPKIETTDLSAPLINEYGIWHVCYSMHSSRDELESALHLLQPTWVISTTPPCRAMELEYVKKHCFKTKIGSDDPLWKLFNVATAKAVSFSSISKPVMKNKTIVNRILLKVSASDDGRQDNELSVTNLKQLDLCSRERPITLFGRARLNPQKWDVFHEYKVSRCTFASDSGELTSCKDNLPSQHAATMDTTGIRRQFHVSSQIVLDLHGNISIVSPEDPATTQKPIGLNPPDNNEAGSMPCLPDHKMGLLHEKSRVAIEPERSSLRFRSSKQLSDSLRKLYRSKNVPVPRSLPPLCQLIDVTKRSREVMEALRSCGVLVDPFHYHFRSSRKAYALTVPAHKITIISCCSSTTSPVSTNTTAPVAGAGGSNHRSRSRASMTSDRDSIRAIRLKKVLCPLGELVEGRAPRRSYRQ